MDRHGLMMAGMAQDHPIFTESIRRIRALLGDTGLQPLEQEVLERLVHSSGDPSIAELLRFSQGACEAGLSALQSGAVILTDTEMAAAAIPTDGAANVGRSRANGARVGPNVGSVRVDANSGRAVVGLGRSSLLSDLPLWC
jgi:precorrin isomerase